MTDLRDWLAFIRLPDAGRATRLALLEQFGTPGAVFSAQPSRLPERLSDTARAWLQAPDWSRVDADLAWLRQSGTRLITRDDPGWPRLLADIPDAPLALFVRGEAGLLAEAQLAVVGSRNPTAGGRDTARDFARHLARAGLVITSGLAMGVDAAAHEGALDGGGATVAVCGTGLDRIYPARNQPLAQRILGRGALVSEFPPGTPPLPENFPRRNRIISGLSLGTLVVEAAQRSGSLITARLAAEQGREVFAIPGSIHNPLSRGCHRLLREGAKLVESAADVLEELGPLAGLIAAAGPAPDHAPPKEQTEETEDGDYETLLNAMGFEPASIDAIVQRSGLPAGAVASMLLILELRGVVTAMPGGRYCRTRQGTG